MEKYFCSSEMGNVFKLFPAENESEKMPQDVHGLCANMKVKLF